MGTGPLQCLVSSGGWPWGGVLSTHSPPMVLPSLARESQHACLLFHPPSAVQHRDHFSTFSFWHKQDVPSAWKCPWRNYTVGLIVYVSLHAGWVWNLPGDCVYYDAARLSHYYHRYCLCFAFLFIYFIFIMIFFLSTTYPVLTPLAASIQPSLSTAQFQPEPQPAELG